MTAPGWRWPLSDDVVERLALDRAHRGGLMRSADYWYADRGRQVPCYLPGALDELTAAGMVELGGPDSAAPGMRRVWITDLGLARRACLRARDLCAQTARRRAVAR